MGASYRVCIRYSAAMFAKSDESPEQLVTQGRASPAHTLPWSALDEQGCARDVAIPAERSLTVYVDKRKVVTLMTLGAEPELLVLGYLRNQRLVERRADVESISIDWGAGDGEQWGLDAGGVAAVKTRCGIADLAQRTAHQVVTTGCGQGSVLGDWLSDLDGVTLPRTDAPLSVGQLHALLNTMRLQETTYKSAGSVHGCALFAVPGDGGEPLLLKLVEDVGRHNALDTLAGWWWVASEQPPYVTPTGSDKLLYTTGRLTSEMVVKAAQMGVPVVVSRSGITQMGAQLAQRVGVCAIGRAVNQRFLCYTHPHRLRWPA